MGPDRICPAAPDQSMNTSSSMRLQGRPPTGVACQAQAAVHLVNNTLCTRKPQSEPKRFQALPYAVAIQTKGSPVGSQTSRPPQAAAKTPKASDRTRPPPGQSPPSSIGPFTRSPNVCSVSYPAPLATHLAGCDTSSMAQRAHQ